MQGQLGVNLGSTWDRPGIDLGSTGTALPRVDGSRGAGGGGGGGGGEGEGQ